MRRSGERDFTESGGRAAHTARSEARRRRLLPAFAALIILLISAGCSESRATKLSKRAEELARLGKYPDAIVVMQNIEVKYPNTTAGRGARKQIVLYRGLMDTEIKRSRRRAKDEMLALARELLEYHEALHRYPQSLDDIDPLHALPRKDPWSLPYRYQASEDGTRYRLECLGSDGAVGGDGDAQDLLAISGTFVKDLPWEDR